MIMCMRDPNVVVATELYKTFSVEIINNLSIYLRNLRVGILVEVKYIAV